MSRDWSSEEIILQLEKENQDLKAFIKEACKVIEFYGNDDNYHRFEQDGYDSEVMGRLIIDKSDVDLPNKIIEDFHGGKRAREFMNNDKYKEIKSDNQIKVR